MVKRMIAMLVITMAVLGGLSFIKYQQVRAAIAQGAAYRPAPEAVTTIMAKQENWPDTLGAIGTITAVQGVTVSADLPGIVDRIEFESGGSVNTGDVLVRLDTRQEQAQLAAAEAAHDLARINFDRLQGLSDQSAISRVDFDRAAADQKQTEAKVEEMQLLWQRVAYHLMAKGLGCISMYDQSIPPGEPVPDPGTVDKVIGIYDRPLPSRARK